MLSDTCLIFKESEYQAFLLATYVNNRELLKLEFKNERFKYFIKIIIYDAKVSFLPIVYFGFFLVISSVVK